MSLILEYEGKEFVFKKYNMPMLKYKLVKNKNEIDDVIKEIGLPLAVKAQILSGGRGKMGLVKFCKTEEEVKDAYADITSREFEGKPINLILFEAGADIKQELFISMVLDENGDIVILFSSEGGIDIETLAKESPEKIAKFIIPIAEEALPHMFVNGIAKQGISGKPKLKIAAIISQLVKMMIKEDLELAEINPLIITSKDEVVAIDSRIGIDESANFRHPERINWASENMRYGKEEKEDAKDNGLAYVDLGGDIGMLCCGAGMGMATADLIEHFGGTPKNFLDVGGGASPEKVENALRIMVGIDGIKSILVNAFGGITRLDDVATGIIEAVNKYKITIPMVIRLIGTNQKEGVEILKKAGFEAYLEMEPSIEKAVQLGKAS